MNSQKFVPIDVIASFRKVKVCAQQSRARLIPTSSRAPFVQNLTEDKELILTVMKQCSTLLIDETGSASILFDTCIMCVCVGVDMFVCVCVFAFLSIYAYVWACACVCVCICLRCELSRHTTPHLGTKVRPNVKMQRDTLILRDIAATTPLEEVKGIFDHPVHTQPRAYTETYTHSHTHTHTDIDTDTHG
jgi:hypothetical protein